MDKLREFFVRRLSLPTSAPSSSGEALLGEGALADPAERTLVACYSARITGLDRSLQAQTRLHKTCLVELEESRRECRETKARVGCQRVSPALIQNPSPVPYIPGIVSLAITRARPQGLLVAGRTSLAPRIIQMLCLIWLQSPQNALADSQTEVAGLRRTVEMLHAQQAATTREAETGEAALATARQQLADAVEAGEAAVLEQLEAMRGELAAVNAEQTKLRGINAALVTQVRDMRSDAQARDDEYVAVSSRERSLEMQLATVGQELSGVRAANKALAAELNAVRLQLSALAASAESGALEQALEMELTVS